MHHDGKGGRLHHREPGAGASVAITINATVNATGTKTNVVVVTNTTPPETNPNNNQAQAQTLVTAPVTPPKPKPPVVVPEICETLVVTPKVLKATGKAQKVGITRQEGQEGSCRRHGQDHRARDREDGEDRQERQGQRDLEAVAAGDRQGRDPGCEGLQHPADRCGRVYEPPVTG